MEKVITICGSTKFKKQFEAVNAILTMKGYVVLTVGSFGHEFKNLDLKKWVFGRKKELDQLHKKKIDLSDAIFVVNVGGYIGDSTKSEIQHALKNGKIIYTLRIETGEEPLLFDYEDKKIFQEWIFSNVY